MVKTGMCQNKQNVLWKKRVCDTITIYKIYLIFTKDSMGIERKVLFLHDDVSISAVVPT